MIDAGRSLVTDHTPVELLGAPEASGFLSELIPARDAVRGRNGQRHELAARASTGAPPGTPAATSRSSSVV